jgi:F0F1-type ATP synthase membrane subunit a
MIVRIKMVWLVIASVILAPFVAVVLLEIISLLFRPISLSLRAYANLYAAHPDVMRWIAPFPSSSELLIGCGILVVSSITLLAVFRIRS